MERVDLAVLGTGPAGHYGAIQAAKLGKKVVAIERLDRVGGVSATTGTLPSKSLREATLHLTGLRQRAFYGMNYTVKDNLTVQDLVASTAQVIRNETSVFEAQLKRNGVRLLRGSGRFAGPHRIAVETSHGPEEIEADVVLIAVGSRPAHPPNLAFDGRKIIDSSQILNLPALPSRLMVVGAGIIGIEYACIFAALGVEVTVVDQCEEILEFVDRQILDNLRYQMQNRDVEFRLGEEVVGLELAGAEVVAVTRSNKRLRSDCLLYSVGRQTNADSLDLAAAGLTHDERGRIRTDGNYQTTVPHIYAAGDVIGFPALAATSREQGRRAICHAFGVACERSTSGVPLGIYAIPEISMIGPTEKQLTLEGVPFEVGIARYREIARGQILGDTDGMLKLLFHRESLKLLAVHIVGEGATELIHIGQAVHAFGGTLPYFVNAVFNYPTLAECYKVAALDGMNRIAAKPAPVTG
jgi:NAD(P) transhydrogenase